MSALAKILYDLGNDVLGCDNVLDSYTNDISKYIDIHTLDDIKYDLKYTYIIGNAYKDLKITKKLLKRGYNVIYYPNFVDNLFNNTNIAISGTHGKTTVTKFLSCLIPDASYLIGDGEGYGIIGKYFIYEACEYKGTFLNYHPDILYVGNIDYDHPDYYKDILDTFLSFNKLSTRCKVLITNGDYYYTNKLNCENKITFGFKISNDCVCDYILTVNGYMLKIKYNDEEIKILYPFYGIHMIYNFLGVYTIMRYLGFSNCYIKSNLERLKLPKRRMEITKKDDNYFICDYAHHPNEIDAFYEGICENLEYKGYKKVIIFEPHTISRLETFKEDYKEVLSKFDDVYLYSLFTSIREEFDKTKVENLYKYLGFKLYENNILFKKSVVCFVGAGNIDKEYYKTCKS